MPDIAIGHQASASFTPITEEDNAEDATVDLVGYIPPEAVDPPVLRDPTHWSNSNEDFPLIGIPHRLEWGIPHEYKLKAGGGGFIDAEIVTRQIFVISSNGDLSVNKIGQFGSVSRTRSRETGMYQ